MTSCQISATKCHFSISKIPVKNFSIRVKFSEKRRQILWLTSGLGVYKQLKNSPNSEDQLVSRFVATSGTLRVQIQRQFRNFKGLFVMFLLLNALRSPIICGPYWKSFPTC